MGITFGGKPVKVQKQSTRFGKHRQLTMEQINRRHPDEPFLPIAQYRDQDKYERYSVAAELKMWAEQRIDEIVPIADHENWLRLKLRDPALEGNRHEPAARKELQHLQDQLEELAADVAYLEAHADRIWQSLDPRDREPLAGPWVADNDDDRLILNAWTRIAQVGFRWPDYYRVERKWFASLPDPLRMDIKEAWPEEGILLGIRHEWETPE